MGTTTSPRSCRQLVIITLKRMETIAGIPKLWLCAMHSCKYFTCINFLCLHNKTMLWNKHCYSPLPILQIGKTEAQGHKGEMIELGFKSGQWDSRAHDLRRDILLPDLRLWQGGSAACHCLRNVKTFTVWNKASITSFSKNVNVLGGEFSVGYHLSGIFHGLHWTP